MNRTVFFAFAASTAVAGTSYLYGQGTPVQLQPTTPGTQQVGNANISGRVMASSLLAESGGATAQVIVGNATSTTGANFGGFFRSDSVLGRALYGRASATSGTTHGVWGQADSPGGRGVTGVAPATTGNATGVWGQTASTTGRGVYGYTTATSGENYGVFGHTSSPAGYGVYSQGNMRATGIISGNGSGLTSVNAAQLGGQSAAAFLQSIPNPLSLSGSSNGPTIRGTNSRTSGIGVHGLTTSTSGLAVGVQGQSNSSGGIGVRGVAEAGTGTGTGGWFETKSNDGDGIYAWAYATNGPTYGVRAGSSSPSGRGVLGWTNATSGTTYGVWGVSDSTSGRAVYGSAQADTGVNYGVRGQTDSPNGFGIYSVGNFAATGTKAFRIDHPLDPENKYLLHYAPESPTPQNFYVGNVVTDARGYAWVELPDYFAEINKNFKYQLTVISDGVDFVQAMVSKKIQANRFQVRTSAPNTEVSWRVDADRNDAYIRHRPTRDVVEKEGPERGLFQHPEFYGFGRERAVDYDEERRRQAPTPEANR